MTREQFGTRLAAARYAVGLTQRDAAARLGVSQARIAEYETGRKVPQLMHLFDMVETLGLDGSILFRPLPDLRDLETPPGRRRSPKRARA